MFTKLGHVTSYGEEPYYFLGSVGYHDTWVYNFFQTTQYMSSLHPSLVNVQEILKVKQNMEFKLIFSDFFFIFSSHGHRPDEINQHLASIVHLKLVKNYVWQPSTPSLIVYC